MFTKVLSPSDTSSIWTFSNDVRQGINQNANEQIFFSTIKPTVFWEHLWCMTCGLSHRKDAPCHLLLTPISNHPLYSKNIVSVLGTFIFWQPQNTLKGTWLCMSHFPWWQTEVDLLTAKKTSGASTVFTKILTCALIPGDSSSPRSSSVPLCKTALSLPDLSAHIPVSITSCHSPWQQLGDLHKVPADLWAVPRR